MSLATQASLSISCSCSTYSSSTICASMRPCRPAMRGLDYASSAAWRPFTPATSQQLSGWLQRSGTRRLGSPSASLAPQCSPSVQGVQGRAQLLQQPAGCPLHSCRASAPASLRWRHCTATARCRAVVVPVGSAAADMGISEGGPPSGPSRADASASAALPFEQPPRPQQGGQRQPSGNGAPSTVASAAAPGKRLQAEAGGEGSSPAAAAAAAAAETPAAAADPGATSMDGLSDTQKYVMADEWGFSQVGGDLPEGTTPANFSGMFPDHFFAFDAARAALAVAVPLAAMAAGYGWLWYMHSICPVWQQLAAATLIGTAFTGLFKVAHECARFSFIPQYPGLQDALGTLLMLPSLYSFTSWRLGYLHHLLHINMLWEDTFGWHPYTKVQLATDMVSGRGWHLALQRLVLATPLKLLASIGHWVRSFDSLDLKRFHPGSYWSVLAGWSAPLLFAGLGIPAMVAAGGVSGLVSCYLLPWLVFHFWLSTLSLLQHTAPHIPFRAAGDGYDAGRATICGTVTVRLPRPLELLLNEANYTLPQAVAPGLPFYHARAAYEHMRERLQPYLTEATPSLKLFTNHVTKWQVYDEEAHTYRPLEEVAQEVEADLRAILEENLAEAEAAAEGEEPGDSCPGGNGAGMAVA